MDAEVLIRAMKYIHLIFLDALPSEAVITVSEFDQDGIENRRVDIWRSGQIRRAGEGDTSNGTDLGTYQFFSMDQFAGEPYLAVEITKEEFENHWVLAGNHVE